MRLPQAVIAVDFLSPHFADQRGVGDVQRWHCRLPLQCTVNIVRQRPNQQVRHGRVKWPPYAMPKTRRARVSYGVDGNRERVFIALLLRQGEIP